MTFLERVHLDTAEQLLDELTPSRPGRLWCHRCPENGWLFRGQANAEWKLVPAAFRRGALARLVAAQIEATYTRDWQRLLEHDHVLRFAAQADAAGYPLFGDSPELRSARLTRDQRHSRVFPPPQYLGFYALAQHYGVPTRLLDWTQRPLFGAYFACVEVAQWIGHPEKKIDRDPPDGIPDRFALWVLSQGLLARHLSPERIRVVTAAAANNPNLRAQEGRFTVVRQHVDNAEWSRLANAPEELPTIDDIIENFDEDVEEEPWLRPALYQFTLPKTEAPRLLYFLALSGVRRASVFASLDAVYRSMAEENWQQIQHLEP